MKELIELIISGEHLSREQAKSALEKMLDGSTPPEQIAAFLTAEQCKGVSYHELLGFHDLLSEKMVQVDLPKIDQIDLCGTGGDGKNSINISTLAAFVVAGAGVPIAKHGNYSASSNCGSSNVLEALGVKFSKTAEDVKKQIESAGISIIHAPYFHPALKTLAPVRKALGIRTIFNLLGPLLNPTKPRCLLIGVPNLKLMRLFANFREAKSLAFSIVSSRDGYDEISLTGTFDINTPRGIVSYSPEALGFQTIPKEALYGGSIEENAKIFMKVLNCEASKGVESVIIANAAFAIYARNLNASLAECIDQASESLQSKNALRKFQILRT
jgi:anthranilate phosphoribosyltransferase